MMEASPISTEDLDLLRRHDTPTVCNVIELFNVRPRTAGYMDERIQACFPELPPMVGFAVTGTFRSASPAGSDVYSNIDDQIAAFGELPGPAVVVFQDLDDPPAAATFGEIVCTTFKTFGAAGLITSGAGRDLEQVREIGFPAFTGGTICAHGYCHIPSVQVPVHVGGITVLPGDLLHGDCNGVTTIPQEIASEVAQACDEFVRGEQVIVECLNGPNITPERLEDARGEYRNIIQKLRTKIGRE